MLVGYAHRRGGGVADVGERLARRRPSHPLRRRRTTLGLQLGRRLWDEGFIGKLCLYLLVGA